MDDSERPGPHALDAYEQRQLHNYAHALLYLGKEEPDFCVPMDAARRIRLFIPPPPQLGQNVVVPMPGMPDVGIRLVVNYLRRGANVHTLEWIRELPAGTQLSVLKVADYLGVRLLVPPLTEHLSERVRGFTPAEARRNLGLAVPAGPNQAARLAKPWPDGMVWLLF